MFSTTTGCDGPMPSVSRPPLAACTDSACCASASGCRGYVGTTAVPSSMRSVTSAASTSAVSASRLHGICGTHALGEAVLLDPTRAALQLFDAGALAARCPR